MTELTTDYPYFTCSGLSKSAEDIRQRVLQFRLEEAESWGRAIEQTGEIPAALWKRMTELGFHKLTLPTWVGGEGLPLRQYFPILEEMAHCHGSIRMMFHAYNSIWCTVKQGTSEQQNQWLCMQVQEGTPIAFALTEPDNGTGIDLHTTAIPKGGKFFLNGRKHLITFAHEASVFAVVAKMEGGAGRGGLTAFLVPKGHEGMYLSRMEHMMGDKGCSHATITFEDCVLTDKDVLGEVGEGFDVALRGFLDQSRAGIAQSAVGLAQQALDVTMAFVRQRSTYGKALSSRQAVQMALADMQIAIQSTRLLCLDAAARYDAGEDISVAAAIAKASAINMVKDVTDQALSLFGGIGYSVGSPIERSISRCSLSVV